MRAETWATLQALAEDPRPWQLKSPALRVFLFLGSELNPRDFVPVKQERISRGLGITQQQVSRALATLVSAELLQTGPREGLVKTYRINPHSIVIQKLYTG